MTRQAQYLVRARSTTLVSTPRGYSVRWTKWQTVAAFATLSEARDAMSMGDEVMESDLEDFGMGVFYQGQMVMDAHGNLISGSI